MLLWCSVRVRGSSIRVFCGHGSYEQQNSGADRDEESDPFTVLAIARDGSG
jgi:hypothetical protein